MKIPISSLIEGALCIALSISLSFIKLFAMPQGGSVSLSMLPILIFSLRRGGSFGVTAGAVTGLLHLFLGGYIIHPVQAMLDYPIASAALGMAGFFHGKKYLGITCAILMNMFASVLSGVIFFSAYAPQGMNVWLYSILYNGSVVIPEGIICAILIYFILPRLNNIQ